MNWNRISRKGLEWHPFYGYFERRREVGIKRYNGKPGPEVSGCAQKTIITDTNKVITKTNVKPVSIGGIFD